MQLMVGSLTSQRGAIWAADLRLLLTFSTTSACCAGVSFGRYLGRAIGEMRSRGLVVDEALISQLSPLGWDHINLTGDYVWSDSVSLDAEGFMPLRQAVQ